MSTKFGLLLDFDLKAAISTNAKLSSEDQHLSANQISSTLYQSMV